MWQTSMALEGRPSSRGCGAAGGGGRQAVEMAAKGQAIGVNTERFRASRFEGAGQPCFTREVPSITHGR